MSGARRLILAAVGFYRRHLSGRGPFARVRCTFEGLESCSAFAERAARESPSAWVALGRIRRRLRRCRHLSLYRLTGAKLGWGRDYDVVLSEGRHALGDALARDGERDAVCDAVGRAAARIAGVRIDGPLPLLRDAEGVRRALTRRRWTRWVLAVLLVLLAGGAILLDAFIGTTLLLLTVAIPVASARAAGRTLRRLDWLEVLTRIDGPTRSEP